MISFIAAAFVVVVYAVYHTWNSIMGFSDAKGLEIALEEARKGM